MPNKPIRCGSETHSPIYFDAALICLRAVYNFLSNSSKQLRGSLGAFRNTSSHARVKMHRERAKSKLRGTVRGSTQNFVYCEIPRRPWGLIIIINFFCSRALLLVLAVRMPLLCIRRDIHWSMCYRCRTWDSIASLPLRHSGKDCLLKPRALSPR